MLNRALTFRMDVRWRRVAVDALALPAGARVLDLACGTGDLCRTLAAAQLRPVGVDFSLGMLHAAHTDAPLVRADALRMPFPTGALDGLTCGFALRNFSALPPAFAECARVLRPGGRLALLDVAEPESRAARAVHGAWFRRVVPFVGGLVSDRDAYRYLPASTVVPADGSFHVRHARRRRDRGGQSPHARVRRRPALHGNAGMTHVTVSALRRAWSHGRARSDCPPISTCSTGWVTTGSPGSTATPASSPTASPQPSLRPTRPPSFASLAHRPRR